MLPSHIKNLITSFINDLQKERQDKEKFFYFIEDLLNKKTKKHITSYKIYKNTLIFYVDSPVWKFQLNLLKPKILEKFKEENIGIKNIKIKLTKK